MRELISPGMTLLALAGYGIVLYRLRRRGVHWPVTRVAAMLAGSLWNTARLRAIMLAAAGEPSSRTAEAAADACDEPGTYGHGAVLSIRSAGATSSSVRSALRLRG